MKHIKIIVGVISCLFFLWKCNLGNNAFTGNENITSEISGTIIDQNTKQSIDSVHVQTLPATQDVYTDSMGKFFIANIEQGAYLLIASKVGYLSDSLNINLTEPERKELFLSLAHDSTFNEISLETTSDYYSFNSNGTTLIPFVIKNFTASTAYYGKCGETTVFATERKVNGRWLRGGWWGSPCLAIYSMETKVLLPYSKTYDTLYVSSRDTFRFVVPVDYNTATDTLTSNVFIVN